MVDAFRSVCPTAVRANVGGPTNSSGALFGLQLASHLSRSQGHRNLGASIGNLRLPISYPYSSISYRFTDKRRFLSKIANFSYTM